MNERGPRPGPQPGPRPGAQPGPEPGPRPGAQPGPRPGANPNPGPANANPNANPNPADVAGVDPERLRREVADVLSEPAPTPADRAEQMERAHGLLQRALGGEGGGRG